MSHDTILSPSASTFAAPPNDTPSAPRPIAHPAHTVAVLFVITLVALITALRATSVIEATPHLLRYTSMLIWQWLLLGAVVAGIYNRRDFFLVAFIHPGRTVLRSLAFALGLYAITFVTLALIQRALYFTPLIHRHNYAIVLAMMPHTPLEFIGWFFVSLSAGICEELIFRGYLLQQLTVYLKRPMAAIVAVGAVFGCIHLYEGAAVILPLTVLGILYGIVVHRLKGDLRVVIIAHALQDFLVALFVFARPLIDRAAPHA